MRKRRPYYRGLKKIICLLVFRFAFVALGAAAAPSPTPVPTPSLEQKALAQKVANAATPADVDALLAQAPATLFRGRELRDAVVRIGYDFSLAGHYPEAEKVDRNLIHLGEKLHDQPMTAVGKMLVATVLRETGHYQDALALLQEALIWYNREPGPTPEKLSAYQGIGVTYLQQGNFRRAFSSLETALEIAREMHNPRGIIPALNSLGELFRSEGQPERALELYEEARKEVGDDSAWNMAFIFNNIGMAYEAMGQTEKALAAINRARVVAEKVGFRPRVATSLAVIGQIHLAAGEFDAAAESYQQSLQLSRDLHDKASEARAWLGLSETHRAQKQFAAALDEALRAGAIDRELQAHDALARTETEAGRNLYSLGRTEEATAALRSAIRDVENLRGEVAGGADEEESFFETEIAPYEELVGLLVDSGKPAEAFAVAQQASARALLDTLAKGPRDSAPSTADSGARLAAANRELTEEVHAAHPSAERVEKLRQEVQRLRAEREIEAVKSGEPTLPTASAAVPVPDLSPLLEGGKHVLLKFVVAHDRAFLFVVHEKAGTPALDTITLGLSRAELAQRSSGFRTLLAERALDWQEPARALYTALMEKAEPFFAGATSLTVIPDGPLWELPFQALQDAKNHCLIEEHAISYAPSIRFLMRIAPSDRKEQPRLFAIADPALGPSPSPFPASMTGEGWEPLPAADQQVAELKTLYPPGEALVLTGAAAREETFKKRAADFQILHFATHGVINDHAPLYSYLLMSQENLAPNEDGLLEAWELMRMNLHARLAVLSACETARGRISDGEGVIGLAWAFLAAGCPTEVVSQWKVDTASNRELLINFHRRVRAGATAAEALRRASLDLAKKPAYRHPFYWAPFVVVGRE